MADLIEMPDGTTVDMTGAPPEAHAALRAKIEQQVATAPKPPGRLETLGRGVLSAGADLARGAGRGLMSLVEGAANTGITSSAVDLFGLPRPKGMTAAPGTEVVNQALPTPQGDSVARRYLRGGLEGLAGAATTGLSAPSLVGGVSAGLAEQGAKQFAPNNPLAQAAAAIVGGVAGGSAAALATRLRPQTASLAREAMEGLTEADLARASNYMVQAKANGTPIDLAQALVATKGNAGNVEAIRNFLATRSAGDKTQALLREQPETLGRAATTALDRLPGTDYGPMNNAANLQEAATDVLKAAKTGRSEDVKELYAKAGNLPPEARNELGKILNKYATEAGGTVVMKSKIKDMADKLMGNDPALTKALADAQTALTAATSPVARIRAREAVAAAQDALTKAKTAPLRALDVDTWIGELRGPFQGGLPLKVAYPREQGQIKGVAGELNKRFQELSPEVAKAERTFRSITESRINPLTAGPVGQVSGRGFDAGTKATMSNLDVFLEKGTREGAKVSEIATLGKELAKSNPAAFESSFKSWVAGKVEGASTSATAAHALGTTDPVKLSTALFDKPNVWQGVKDAAKVMAGVRGVNPDEYIRGLENLKQLTKAMSSRVNASGLTPQDLERLGGASTTADLVRLASFLPMNRAGAAIERAVLGKTLSQFDDILTSPEGAKMLVELGKTPVMSKKAQVLLGTYAGIVANPPELKSSNPKE